MRTGLYSTTFLAASLAALSPVRSEALSASYLYQLSTTTGPLTASAATLSYDAFHQELYAITAGIVHVFNPSGMEVYTWPEDPALGSVWGVAALENGDVLVLRYQGLRPGLLRCDYRGTPVEEVTLPDLEAAFSSGFSPQLIAQGAGKIYLVATPTRRVFALDLAAGTATPIDLDALLQIDDRHKNDGIDGFAADGRGNLYVTVATLFKVFVISPGGQVHAFGTGGSAPGKFGIVKGVAADGHGHIYVSDRLKSVVMVFDQDGHFQGEFGGRANRPGGIYAPYDVVTAEGKLYVSQQARRGVSVFSITH